MKVAINPKEIGNKLSNNILTVAIGPITSNLLNKYNIKNVYPNTYTVKDMIELTMEELK